MLFIYLLIISLILIIGILYIVYYRNTKNKNWSIVHTLPKSHKNKHQRKNKVCIISADNRISEDITLLKNINQKYCDINGYDFKFYDNDDITKVNDNGCSLYQSYPPYWWKVKMVYDMMINSDYDYLMWIDSDACFHNHTISVESLFQKNKIFIMSKDNPKYTSQFNAGIWMVKNNKIGKRFMKSWLNKYEPSRWYRKNNSWVCKYHFLPCAWSGFYYEQGAGYHLMNSSEYSPYILQLSNKILQGYQKPTKNSYTIHFAGDDKKYIKSYVKKYQ